MTPRPTHRVDAVAGAAVAALGLAALIGSIRMPRFEERGASILQAPGLTPGMLGLGLAILGLVLMLRGLSGRSSPRGTVKILDWDRPAAARTALTLALVAAYGLVLFGRAPFIPATAGFVFAFTLGAEWLAHGRPSPRTIAGAAALGLISSWAVQTLFEDLFLVQIPG